jgi:hypothetical protein
MPVTVSQPCQCPDCIQAFLSKSVVADLGSFEHHGVAARFVANCLNSRQWLSDRRTLHHISRRFERCLRARLASAGGGTKLDHPGKLSKASIRALMLQTRVRQLKIT